VFIIEQHIIKEIEQLTGMNCYPNYLPEGAKKPAIVYNTISTHSHKNLSEIKHRSATIQLTIISDTYSAAKISQQKIHDFFEYYENDDSFSYVSTTVNNIVDLYKLQLNQIAIDLGIQYVVK